MTNYHRRKEPEIDELESTYAEAVAAEQQAFKWDGKYGREFRNAQFARRLAERALSRAKSREAERERVSRLTPKEIVDGVMQ